MRDAYSSSRVPKGLQHRHYCFVLYIWALWHDSLCLINTVVCRRSCCLGKDARSNTAIPYSSLAPSTLRGLACRLNVARCRRALVTAKKCPVSMPPGLPSNADLTLWSKLKPCRSLAHPIPHGTDSGTVGTPCKTILTLSISTPQFTIAMYAGSVG